MPRFVVKQPNGLYAVFSTVVDKFILMGATREMYEQWYVNQAIGRAKQDISESIAIAEDSKASGHMSWYQAVETIETCYSEADADDCRKFGEIKQC